MLIERTRDRDGLTASLAAKPALLIFASKGVNLLFVVEPDPEATGPFGTAIVKLQYQEYNSNKEVE